MCFPDISSEPFPISTTIKFETEQKELKLKSDNILPQALKLWYTIHILVRKEGKLHYLI